MSLQSFSLSVDLICFMCVIYFTALIFNINDEIMNLCHAPMKLEKIVHGFAGSFLNTPMLKTNISSCSIQ